MALRSTDSDSQPSAPPPKASSGRPVTSDLSRPEWFINRELSLLEFNRRVLDLATGRHEGGVASYLEVISAQQALLAAERQAAQVQAQRERYRKAEQLRQKAADALQRTLNMFKGVVSKTRL